MSSMRVLFIPLAWPSHYMPMATQAWAMRAAGHDVRVAGQPGVVDAILRSGMTAVPVGGGYDLLAGLAEVQRRLSQPASMGAARQLAPEELAKILSARMTPHVKAAEAMADDLAAFTRSWRPDLVIADPTALVAPLVTEPEGIPLVRHLFGPDVSRHIGFPGAGLPPERWPGELVELYKRFGVLPRADYAVHTVDPCPARLQVPVPARLPVRCVPYNGPGVLPGWLHDPPGRPRVCVSWSTTTAVPGLQSPDRSKVADMLRVLAGLDVEAVVTVRDGAAFAREHGDAVRAVENLPLNLLLPTCDAIVHHGGAGTMLTAAYHGVPQVIVAPVPDQSFNADLLADTGAGVSLKAESADAGDIESGVAKVLFDDRTRDAAALLRQEMLAQPSPAQVVTTLEETL
ncbi:nucleotide disphospho-sugar-binding domain-containing protein [Nonomuraea zeae]|uniref:DUF1205 domain-containing protein n=1 Tax=Nonomuraea zeae TaxID=1642303 RepID=A0A5S4GQW6_9ACTN|nr:nucleotide disphospho-sugar-binding domain-containing protein [Nonomuraea zeae]TMR35303.1 DUF1205 domain-containing protein [Nonomuraea zeae]